MNISKPMIYKPRVEQRQMHDMALDLARCGIWARMGTGKTGATLTALRDLQLVDSRPSLVLAPLRVARSTWPDEAAKWDHLSGMEVLPITGDLHARRAAAKRILSGSVDVGTINYENLPWLIEHLDGRWPFGTVVADEATRLRGFRLRQGSIRARALGKVAHKNVDRFIELTGTPAPNGYLGLWGQLWFLDQGRRLGASFSAYRDRWFKMGYDGYSFALQKHAKKEIDDRLKDICQTIETTHALDAPIETTIRVELPSSARQIYRDMEKTMFASLGDGTEIEAHAAAARSNKCHQIANGILYTDDKGAWRQLHDAKLQALESVIEEANGAPVLVAYTYKPDLAVLKKTFPKGRELDANPATIREWNAGRIPILFAHPASAGHGLNLQDGGNILAFYSVDWDLELYQQIIERIGPQRQKQSGHDRPVYVYHIIATNTVDEDILWSLANKATVQESLMRAMRRKFLHFAG